MSFTVDRSIIDDFSNELNAGQFHEEIIDDVTITTALVSIAVDDDEVFIKFISEPSPSEIIALDALIVAHIPITPPELTTSSTGTNATTLTITSTQTVDRVITIPDITDTIVTLTASQVLTNKELVSPRINTSILDTTGNELISFTPIVSAVNKLTITNASTGSNPSIIASGDDSNIGIDFITAGLGAHIFDNTSNAAEIRLNDVSGSQYIGLKSSDVTTSYTLTLPPAQGSIGDVLENNGSGAMTWLPPPSPVGYFSAYDNTGNAAFTTTPITILINTVTSNDGDWSIASGEVTALITETYMFIIDVGTATNSGTGRSGCVAYIEADTGSGFSEVTGTRTSMYNRGAGYGFQNASVSLPISVSTGDKFRIRIVRNHGSDILQTFANSSRITIIKIKGSKGDTGAAGASGNITWNGQWISQNYTVNQSVEYLGSAYTCILNTTINQNPLNNTYWDLLASKGDQGIQGIQGIQGLTGYLDWQGAWVSQNYILNQGVFYLGNSFVCILDTTTSQTPMNNTYWDIFASQGDTGPAGSGNTVNTLSGGFVITGAPFEKLNFEGFSLAQNNGDSLRVDIALAVRNFGALSADPVATPIAGETYFNTVLNHKMFYDASRSKWLSEALMFEGNGVNGSTNAGNYFKRFNGMQLTATRGPRVGKGTVVSIGFGCDTTGVFTYEVMIDGVSVATIASGGASSAYSDTINGNFNSGIMTGRNQSGGVTVSNLQASIGYRYRA